jgi:hypothetical protein
MPIADVAQTLSMQACCSCLCRPHRLRAEPAPGRRPPTTSPQVTVAKPAKRLVAGRDEYVGRFVASTPSRCARACRATSMPSISRTGSW